MITLAMSDRCLSCYLDFLVLNLKTCSGIVVGSWWNLPFDLFSFVFLQSAKMFNYGTGWKSTSDALFVVFAVVFLVTRLIIFPGK